jgi:hypothetical protein
MTLVRIVGLMRSGTNLLTWMLRHNFESLRTATMLLGWATSIATAALSIDDYVDRAIATASASCAITRRSGRG